MISLEVRMMGGDSFTVTVGTSTEQERDQSRIGEPRSAERPAFSALHSMSSRSVSCTSLPIRKILSRRPLSCAVSCPISTDTSYKLTLLYTLLLISKQRMVDAN